MSRYGIPYKGSKQKIAKDILEKLPSGKRLVDLFGGGFAITHCAMTEYPHKWQKFYWNDKNPLLKHFIQDCINGKYNYQNFHPEWVSREQFKRDKENNGYIKWVWSFCNDGMDYMYGKTMAEDKRKVFEFIVNGIESDVTEGIKLEGDTVQERRLDWMHKAKQRRLNDKVHRCESIERVERLQALERVERLQALEMDCIDYRDYKYQEGDVVYCDIPYADDVRAESFDINGERFNHKEFYEWAKAQPFDVYYSSYTNGEIVWKKNVRTTMNHSNQRRIETLFRI